jgi:phosphatidate cytidylyltransferase
MLRVRVLTACVLAAALLLTLFALPVRWAALVFAGVFIMAAWEWAGFGGLQTRTARLSYTAGMAVLLALCFGWSGSHARLMLLLATACVWWLLAFAWLVLAPGRNHPMLALICGVPVLLPAFVALARLLTSARGFARGPELVLGMLLVVFAADIGAFFAGRRFGRHKLAPRVSPGKTWEGAVGGLCLVAAVGLAGALFYGLPVVQTMVFCAAVGIYSVVGDLTESMFKRAAALKDSSALLPGHGGILDRIDSITAAAPLYALGLFGSGAIE